jgi:hypothetical protein
MIGGLRADPGGRWVARGAFAWATRLLTINISTRKGARPVAGKGRFPVRDSFLTVRAMIRRLTVLYLYLS